VIPPDLESETFSVITVFEAATKLHNIRKIEMSKSSKNENAKGALPSNRWLIRNGYRELVECIKKHPDKFKHIKHNRELERKENQ